MKDRLWGSFYEEQKKRGRITPIVSFESSKDTHALIPVLRTFPSMEKR